VLELGNELGEERHDVGGRGDENLRAGRGGAGDRVGGGGGIERCVVSVDVLAWGGIIIW
jgi:hypothetical protein